MISADFNRRLYETPFKAFTVHLADGSSVNVALSGKALVGESSVIIPTEFALDREGYPLVKRWRCIPLAEMVQFSDIDEPVGGKRPKGRGRK